MLGLSVFWTDFTSVHNITFNWLYEHTILYVSSYLNLSHKYKFPSIEHKAEFRIRSLDSNSFDIQFICFGGIIFLSNFSNICLSYKKSCWNAQIISNTLKPMNHILHKLLCIGEQGSSIAEKQACYLSHRRQILGFDIFTTKYVFCIYLENCSCFLSDLRDIYLSQQNLYC